MPVFIAFIVEAGWSILSWLLKTVVIKFVVAAIFYFVIHGVLTYALANILPTSSNLSAQAAGAMSSLTPQIWFVLDILDIQTGASLMFAALATRVAIKFLPKL
ncbi:UNVERIFIED_ORG: uncharacterized membrane protein YjjP (DUF1212 family) [Paraburkholderia sediminicola]|nr:uncharacterized membrane protein YjjP (DUF1212 family) [Paraburkholderia sediminicola]